MKNQHLNNLTSIPGVGKSIAKDLENIGIFSVEDLRGKDPQQIYEASNHFAGCVQDRCLLMFSGVRCILLKRRPKKERVKN